MKLLILLGAGSSYAQIAPDGKGFPLIGELSEEVKIWAQEYAASRIDYYGKLLKLRLDYNKGYAWLDSVNFEQILGDFHSLWNGLRRSPFADPVLAKAAEAIGFENDDGHQFGIAQSQLENLFSKLASRLRDTSQRFEGKIKQGETPVFSGYKNLLQRLSKEFDLGIYNLNYDTVALNAVQSICFTGFDKDSGLFLPETVHGQDWNFIYHLHGSVHFSFNEAPDDQIIWEKNLGREFRDTKNIAIEGTDNRVRIASTIVAGGRKLDQLQDEPFQSFYSSLPRHVYEADAILIGGYGFGDSHINSVLTNVLLNRRRKIRILLLEKGAPNSYPKLGQPAAPLTNDSPWVRAKKALRFPGLNRPGVVPAMNHPEIEYLDDAHTPTAIWLRGFETAYEKSDAIIQWLKWGSFEG